MTTAGDIALGAALRRERRRAGWSRSRLAARLGISTSDLHAVEAGERLRPSTVVQAARALGRPPAALLPSEREITTALLVAGLDAAEAASGCSA